MTEELFPAYTKQVLAPTLRGHVVILGNPPARGNRSSRDHQGEQAAFPPAYSLDFNPIENAFAKLKAMLRRAAARNRLLLLITNGWLAQLGGGVISEGDFTALFKSMEAEQLRRGMLKAERKIR